MLTSRSCCCCLLRPPHSDMKTPYKDATETKETYADMLADCFGIHMGEEYNECGICEDCAGRLRDASHFKLQVQRSQEELQKWLEPEVYVKDEKPELETFKLEMLDDDNLPEDLVLKLDEGELACSQPASPAPSSGGDHAVQTASTTLEHSDEDEASHMPWTRTDQKQAQANFNNNTSRVRKQKQSRTTRRLQAEQENDVTYTLRSKVTLKSERPLNDYNDINTTGPYTCEICNKVVATKRSMACHMHEHNTLQPDASEAYTWDCDICQKVLASRDTLRVHMRNLHGKKLFKCHVCSKRFSNISNFNLHKRLHIEGEKRFCCELCGKRFHSHYNLAIHKRCHTGDKPFTCDTCEKRFVHKYALRNHIYSHMDVTPFSCKNCNLKFKSVSTYKRHNLRNHNHKETKVLCCEICQKRFMHSHHLKTHKNVHTGERPYACETCGKMFADKSNLRVHLLTHVKGQTYSCELCPKSYSTKEGLRQHKRVHTREKEKKQKQNIQKKRKNTI